MLLSRRSLLGPQKFSFVLGKHGYTAVEYRKAEKVQDFILCIVLLYVFFKMLEILAGL